MNDLVLILEDTLEGGRNINGEMWYCKQVLTLKSEHDVNKNMKSEDQIKLLRKNMDITRRIMNCMLFQNYVATKKLRRTLKWEKLKL